MLFSDDSVLGSTLILPDCFLRMQPSGYVSPGYLTPSSYFGRVIASGQYLLPQYVHAFVLASDIKIFFPHLGSWHFSDEHESSVVINTLMEYTFAEKLSGNFGPFSFEVPRSGSGHNFQIKRNKLNGGLVITLPGAQVVGYIINTVPKFPRTQPVPSLNRTKCECDEVAKLVSGDGKLHLHV